jgi:hypothetical protein
MIGSSRGKDIREQFDAAYAHDRITTLRMLLWARDARDGSGEREVSRTLLRHLAKQHPEDAERLIPHLAIFGRWDDLLVFDGGYLQDAAFSVIAEGLADPKVQRLVAKWMPRYPSSSPSSRRRKNKRTGEVLGVKAKGAPSAKRQAKVTKADALRKFLRLSERDYRRILANLSRTVEQQMCAGQWDAIEFGKIPSVAAARYQKAFNRRCAAAYATYKEGLKKGTEKINAGAIFPYDVIKTIDRGDRQVAVAQWDALPNYLGDDRILPMVDVSGSMTSQVPGSTNLTCLDVSVSLGLYVADKQKGAFNGCWLNFSSKPKIRVLTGDIAQKYHSLKGDSDWEMSTNIEGAFSEILRVAKAQKVPADEMPKMLLVLSDMEFDRSSRGKDTAFDVARRKFEEAGYALPKIVWWNLNARADNNPVTARQDGTALVSGFSPSIMKSILKAQDFSPDGVMRSTLNVPRYADVIY